MQNDTSKHKPIAVVGVSALFPGSQNANGFWGDILAGTDMVKEIPKSHWLIEDYYDQDQFPELLRNRGAHQIISQQKRPPTITVPTLNNRSNHLKDGNLRASPCWLSFSNNGDKLYSCNGHVRIWDVANGVSTVHCSAHACCSMSPDSSKLAGFYYDPDGDIEDPLKLINDEKGFVKLCVSNFDGKNDGVQLKKD